MNDAGRVVGYSDPAGSGLVKPFVWANGTTLAVPPPQGAVPIALNGLGQAAGIVGQHAGVWRNLGQEGSGPSQVNDIGSLGLANQSSAIDIDDSFRVAGTSRICTDMFVCNGMPYREHGFLWSEATGMQDLGTLGGSNSIASAMNANGQVVGSSDLPAGGSHAFLWSGGTMQDLGTLGGSSSSAASINAAGQVVGTSTNAAGQNRAFLWQNGTMQDLGTIGDVPSLGSAINTAGDVVGTLGPAGSLATGVFVWHAGAMRDIGTLGGGWSNLSHTSTVGPGHMFNDAGHVVGSSETASGQTHAFLWDGSTMRDIGTLGGNDTFAVWINNVGQVTGYSRNANNAWHAFCSRPAVLRPLRPASERLRGVLRALDIAGSQEIVVGLAG